MAEGEKIIQINIEDEMKSAYIDYSMSVIVSRALPDVRDGFKPVHRRVLYGMQDLGVYSNRPHKKSARIVGEVLGKYHPHGDSSIYGALVNLANKDFFIDKQGNFGNVLTGDNASAARYIECRLTPLAREVLFNKFRTGEVTCLVVSKVANFSIDLPDATIAIQVSGAFGSRQEEAQRLGRILRPKSDGRSATFYSVISRDTIDQDFAQNRQRFLAEQGYSYKIIDADDVFQGKI